MTTEEDFDQVTCIFRQVGLILTLSNYGSFQKTLIQQMKTVFLPNLSEQVY